MTFRWKDFNYAPRTALYLPDVASNRISAPDTPALSITGDLDLRWRGKLDSWANGSLQILISKWTLVDFQRSYYLAVSATGAFQLVFSPDGINSLTRQSTALLDLNASFIWLRAALDVDDGAGNHVAYFYTSLDGAVWTLLGSPVTTASTISIFDSTSTVDISGTAAGSYRAAGLYSRAQIRASIDGPIVADWCGDGPAERYRDAYGNVWTISGTANAWQAI